MTLHHLTPAPRILLTIRDDLGDLGPVHVYRDGSTTLLAFAAGAPISAVSEGIVMQLTTPELNVVRAAVGEPPVGLPASGWWFEEDRPVDWDLLPDELLTARAARAKAAWLALRPAI